MNETDYRLDEKYTEGVWYDTYCGDYCKIRETGDMTDETLVELLNPETDNVYHEIPVADWVKMERHHFHKVSDEAVEDPVAVVNRALRGMGQNSISQQEAIDVRYARGQVEIHES